MAHVFVDTLELREFLDSLKSSVEIGLAGEGSFKLSAEGLELDWSGAGRFFAAVDGTEMTSQLTVIIAENSMRSLEKALPEDGPTKLRVAGGRLFINTMSLGARVVDGTAQETGNPAIQIALNASSLKVAMLHFTHSAKEIEGAGLTLQVAAANARRAECCEAAAKKLEWLGIDAAIIGGWVEGHLQTSAVKRVKHR